MEKLSHIQLQTVPTIGNNIIISNTDFTKIVKFINAQSDTINNLIDECKTITNKYNSLVKDYQNLSYNTDMKIQKISEDIQTINKGVLNLYD